MNLTRIGIIEFISTFFLIVLIYQNAGKQLFPIIVGGTLAILLTFGGNHIPHMNPALSLIFSFDDENPTNFSDLKIYIPCQLLGAFAAYYYVKNVNVK